MRCGLLRGLLNDVNPSTELPSRKTHFSVADSQNSPPEGIRPWLGVPPIGSGFPAVATRSSSVQPTGRSGRSCSPN